MLGALEVTKSVFVLLARFSSGGCVLFTLISGVVFNLSNWVMASPRASDWSSSETMAGPQCSALFCLYPWFSVESDTVGEEIACRGGREGTGLGLGGSWGTAPLRGGS